MTTYQNKVLEAVHVTRSYQDIKIIEDINLVLYEGELVSILGPSGVGKTTLFHILSGLDRPDGGKVFLRGEDKTGVSGLISYMQQKDLLLPFRTIEDNLSLPLMLKGEGKKEALEKARGFFSAFGLSGCEKKYPHQISGGMRQRAAFLRSYLYQADIMLLDEPFGALDAITKHQMHAWYLEMAEKHNTSTLFITHDIDEAIALSHRIYMILGTPGRIVAEIKLEKEHCPEGEFLLSARYMAYKKEILSFMTESLS